MEIGRVSDLSGSFEAFPGVIGKVLFGGKNLMFFLVEIKGAGIVPEHSHPHEQMGIFGRICSSYLGLLNVR